ncbi:hypothetical protein ABZ626_33960 [Streptomyces longispororuber]|uniref:hypothetical protein n=1 Tax=Streptomyces longispororuber TaxID=68230 RepID=UPI0033F51CD8
MHTMRLHLWLRGPTAAGWEADKGHSPVTLEARSSDRLDGTEVSGAPGGWRFLMAESRQR